MAERNEVFKCTKCGQVIVVASGGGGDLSCCDFPMKFMKEGSTDGALEKHVPVIEKTANGYKVTVGSVLHPMEYAHWIQWIEIIADGRSCRKFLKPGDAPVVEFGIQADKVIVREYCNLHGHWKAES